MSTPTIEEQVRWQDLRVRSEVDRVFEIAKRENWEDCEVFGSGDMITYPEESMGWKLIPADLYEDSIPLQAVERLHQVINAGIRVKGVIIADDQRRLEPEPLPTPGPASAPAPAKPKVSLSFVRSIASWTGKALLGSIRLARAAGSFSSQAVLGFIHLVEVILSSSVKALLVLIRVAGMLALLGACAYALIHFGPIILLLGGFIALVAFAGPKAGSSSRVSYDPKLIVLVDDGEGGTTWISLFTWYD